MARVSVTDHAVVRYLQRVYGLPIEDVRAEIAAKVEAELGLRALKRTQGIAIDGHVVVLRGRNAVTVLRPAPPRPTRRQSLRDLPEGDPREPGSRPATDGDPWWWAMAGGWDYGPGEEAD